jgi:hypothetical protein
MRSRFVQLVTAFLIFEVVLCIGTALLWARSYGRMDVLKWTNDWQVGEIYSTRGLSWESAGGGFLIYYARAETSNPNEIANLKDYYSWHPHGFEWISSAAKIASGAYIPVQDQAHPLGVQFGSYHRLDRSISSRPVWLAIPYWLVMAIWVLLFAGTLASYRPWLRRFRRRRGLCTRCGYDLRGSTNRCPECGLAFQRNH